MVMYGRVIPFIRTFISLPAGMAEMNVAKFVGLTAIGVTVWVSLLSGIGYALGSSWNAMVQAIGYLGYVVAAIVVVSIAVFLIHRYRAGSTTSSIPGHEVTGPVESEQTMMDEQPGGRGGV